MKTISVRAIDIIPYKYSLMCYVGDEPHLMRNEICCRRPDEGDPKYIWFMLDSHNFMRRRWDENVDFLVENDISNERIYDIKRKDLAKMKPTFDLISMANVV